jgi:ECF sigma factor
MKEVTQIYGAMQQGDLEAAEELLPLVYQEFRRLATFKMAGEAPRHTLPPTTPMH